MRVRLYTENGKHLALGVARPGFDMLKPIRETNGFIRVEAESAGFKRGETVMTIPPEREFLVDVFAGVTFFSGPAGR